MAIKLPVLLRNTRADTFTTRIGASGLLRIYSGTQPTDADTAIGAQVLLAQLTCGATFAAAAATGVLTANAITSANAAATGVATWFRLVNAGATVNVTDGTVTATGSGGDLQLVTTSITSGQPVQVTALTITEGGA